MSDYLHLPYNESCWKATHNSYDRGGFDLATQLAFDPIQPNNHGARGLELDLYQDKMTREFWVCHNPPKFSSHVTPLSHYLTELMTWSDTAGDHDPITVTLDIKQMRGGGDHWPSTIDRYLLRHFDGARIFRPRHFRNAGNNLVQAVHHKTWPTIGDLRGKFLFVFSGAEKRKKQYARDPFARVCFADRLIKFGSAVPSTSSGNRIFLNFALGRLDKFEDITMDADWDLSTLDDKFAPIVGDTRYVTRGYGLNTGKCWTMAGKLGVNVRATDASTGKNWATVGSAPFAPRTFSGILRRRMAGTG